MSCKNLSSLNSRKSESLSKQYMQLAAEERFDNYLTPFSSSKATKTYDTTI
jgi:hypothetical protein